MTRAPAALTKQDYAAHIRRAARSAADAGLTFLNIKRTQRVSLTVRLEATRPHDARQLTTTGSSMGAARPPCAVRHRTATLRGFQLRDWITSLRGLHPAIGSRHLTARPASRRRWGWSVQ